MPCCVCGEWDTCPEWRRWYGRPNVDPPAVLLASWYRDEEDVVWVTTCRYCEFEAAKEELDRDYQEDRRNSRRDRIFGTPLRVLRHNYWVQYYVLQGEFARRVPWSWSDEISAGG